MNHEIDYEIVQDKVHVSFYEGDHLVAFLIVPMNQPVITKVDGWDYDLYYSTKAGKLTITEFKDEWPVIV